MYPAQAPDPGPSALETGACVRSGTEKPASQVGLPLETRPLRHIQFAVMACPRGQHLTHRFSQFYFLLTST